MTDFSPFDNYGNVDETKITPEVMAGLNDAQRKALADLLEADGKAKAAEARVIETRKRVAELSADHDAKLNAYHKLQPPMQHAELVRLTIEVQNGRRKPEPTIDELKKAHVALQAKARASDAALKKSGGGTEDEAAAHDKLMAELKAARLAFEKAEAIANAKQAWDDAAEALAAARAEETQAKAAVNPARHAQGNAVMAWSATTRKLTQMDLARDMARRTAEQALAAHAAEPEGAVKVWPVQTALANRKAAEKANRAPRQMFTR